MGLTLELVTHFFYYNIYMYYVMYHKDIEIHIKYRNKKWVTDSKGDPNYVMDMGRWPDSWSLHKTQCQDIY